MYTSRLTDASYIIMDPSGEVILSSMDCVDSAKQLLDYLNCPDLKGYVCEEVDGVFEVYNSRGMYVAGMLSQDSADALLSHLNRR